MADLIAKPEGRVHKRIISDQQKRRDIALQRQSQGRRDLQHHARQLVSLAVPLSSSPLYEEQDAVRVSQHGVDHSQEHLHSAQFVDLAEDQDSNQVDNAVSIHEEDTVTGMLQATKLKGSKAREWFKQQFMMPEWMVDVPTNLQKDWYVMARPGGQRCIVVSSNGSTISRLRNGQILHCFPSALPNGARTRETVASSQVFCILDCIFHKPDSIYYVIDMLCWRGYSLYDCNYEFRHFWIQSKLAETGVFAPPSKFHRYQFSIVPASECDKAGLQAAYNGNVPFERDGCLFLNRHAHYVLGVTPLALLWKDSASSHYHIDTDSKGNVPAYQQIVLELQEDGTVATCDEPKVVLGSMPQEFLKQNKQHLRSGMLLKFAIGDQGLKIANGRPVAADIHYQGLANRFRAGADSASKVLFQYAARHDPLSLSHILAAIEDSDHDYQMET